LGTSYSEVYQKFVYKVEAYKLLEIPVADRETVIQAYLEAACAKFYKTCRTDLINRDGDIGFKETLAFDELDILTDLMVVEWMQPKIYSDELMESRLNTKDFSEYSPAKMIEQIRGTYALCRKNAKQAIIDYSYSHGDVGDMNK
jgi:hypothetical protein